MTERIDNIVLAATLLHANGQTTQRVISASERLANAYGLDMHVVPQWDDILFRFRPKDDKHAAWQTEIIHVRPTGVDMNKVSLTTGIIDQIAAQSQSTPQEQTEEHLKEQLAQTQLAFMHIAALKPSHHPRFILMAGVGATALGVIFGVTSHLTLALIFLAAILGAAVRRGLAGLSDNLLVQPFVAALIAGLVGGAAQRTLTGADLQFIDIAPCMILVPGAHILNAALDLVRGRISLGLARLMYSGLIVLAICMGLLIGLVVFGTSLAQGLASAHVPLWLDFIAAGLAVSAFGAFFSIPWKILFAPIAIGMLCHASRWWVLDQGGGVALGAFIACMLAGVMTALLARFLKLPFAALAFSAVVSMMPGIFLFKFANGIVAVYLAGEATSLSTLTDVVSNGTASVLIVMVMTFGLILPKMLIDAWLGPDDLRLNA